MCRGNGPPVTPFVPDLEPLDGRDVPAFLLSGFSHLLTTPPTVHLGTPSARASVPLLSAVLPAEVGLNLALVGATISATADAPSGQPGALLSLPLLSGSLPLSAHFDLGVADVSTVPQAAPPAAVPPAVGVGPVTVEAPLPTVGDTAPMVTPTPPLPLPVDTGETPPTVPSVNLPIVPPALPAAGDSDSATVTAPVEPAPTATGGTTDSPTTITPAPATRGDATATGSLPAGPALTVATSPAVPPALAPTEAAPPTTKPAPAVPDAAPVLAPPAVVAGASDLTVRAALDVPRSAADILSDAAVPFVGLLAPVDAAVTDVPPDLGPRVFDAVLDQAQLVNRFLPFDPAALRAEVDGFLASLDAALPEAEELLASPTVWYVIGAGAAAYAARRWKRSRARLARQKAAAGPPAGV